MHRKGTWQETLDKIKLCWELLKEIWKGGANVMAVIYATLIINGAKTIADVPALIRAQVAETLVNLGVPELAE